MKKFSVLELYQLYQERPETFAPILRNVNSSEVNGLIAECRSVNGLIEGCNIEGHMPWDDIYEEAAHLIDEFEDAISFFGCFRKIDMGGYMYADQIVTNLELAKLELKDSCQVFRNGIYALKSKVGRSADSEDDVEAQYRELSTPLNDCIKGVIAKLEELDKAI